ncbi:MAG: homocysteine S-methyltransferase family protein [Luminiphilus sp.]|nr:homocysteine S-methyltransferase family protein [Luminiphilus sp.]
MSPTVTLLDGGLGQELIKRSSAPPHPLWATQVMIDEPHLVSEIHRDFCDAGARVICLNTYAVSRHRLATYAPEKSLQEVLDTALAAADAGIASSQSASEVSTVASLPPLNASYDHTVAPDFESAYAQYRELISLQKTTVSAFLLETMSNIAEATAGAKAIRDEGVVGAVAFTLSDRDATKLRSGEPLADAIDAVLPHTPDAILINCSTPEIVSEGLKIVAKSGIKFGAYANGFVSVDALVPGSTVDRLAERKDLGPDEYLAFVKSWLELGAEIVGGCCEIGPDHIKAISTYLAREGIAISRKIGA